MAEFGRKNLAEKIHTYIYIIQSVSYHPIEINIDWISKQNLKTSFYEIKLILISLINTNS